MEEKKEKIKNIFIRICRNCGKEIDIKYFIKSRVCPHCNKVFSDYVTDLHITFSSQFKANFMRNLENYDGTFYENCIEYRSFCLEYFMEIGDLSNAPYSNEEEYDRVYRCLPKELIRVEKVLEEIQAFNSKIKIYLWVDDKDVNDYLNFLFFCNEFRNFDEVYFVPSRLGHIKGDYDPKKALDKKEKLSKIKLDRLNKKFYKIKTQKDKINILVDNKIKSVSIEKFAGKFLELVKPRYEQESLVRARYFKKYRNTEFELTYWQILRVIFYLYDNEKIEFRYDEDSVYNKIRLQKESPKEKKRTRFTSEEKDLIKLLIEMGFNQHEITTVFVVAEKRSVRKTLLKYLEYKGKYATLSDMYCFSGAAERIEGKRHQYLPPNMYVRYIGKTNDELIHGDYYQVYTVYGVKEQRYFLINEKDRLKEYPASNFILLRPAKISYMGEDENGLVSNEEYDVVEQKGMTYILANGKEVECFEADEIEFVPAEEKKKKPIEHDTLLHMLRHAFEFGDMHQVYHRMTDSTIYYSFEKDLTITGRDDILEYIEDIFRKRVEQDVYADVVCSTATKDFEGHKVGDRFLMVFSSDKTKNSIFAYSDGTYITKIVVSNGWPAYTCDETPINKLK